MEEIQNHRTECVLLQPFIHQVGGHSSMLCLDEATVCKPAVNQEQKFYETIPECLKPFVPMYYGPVKVQPIQDGDYIILSATKPPNYNPEPSKTLKQVRIRKNGNIEVEGLPVSAAFESVQTMSEEGLVQMNPWVLKCHREYIVKLMGDKGSEPVPLNFILLENLTWRFNLPCILDLKMGTRQHGDNDSVAKRQSKMVKVITTTTAKLGVRFGGMQVYQASSGKFLCFNKLYGRTLSVAGFHNAIRNFFHDGIHLRTDALPPLIRRLEDLHNTLSNLDSIRLFTTSLLLLYQGQEASRDTLNNGEMRDVTSSPEVEQEMRTSRSSSMDRQNDSLKIQSDFRQRSSSCNPSRKPFRPVELNMEEPLTDVRIIDFAHSTHRAMDDSVTYSGPDSGFLFGLSNMIQVLKSIQTDSKPPN